MKNYIEIDPSGDETGRCDARNIQREIDRLTRGRAALTEGAVLASGEYFLDAPLRIGGTLTSDDVSPVSLIGVGHARINYVGLPMSDYAVRYLGGDSEVTSEGLRNLTVSCHGRCRGVLVSTATYVGNVHNLHVRDSIGVGVDLIDCWAASISNVHVQNARGYAVRAYRCNASYVHFLRINGQPGDWPASDDEAAVNCKGQPYRTTDRCGLHINECEGLEIHNLTCEGAHYGDDPVVWLRGKSCLLERPYFENNRVAHELIRVRGSQGWGRRNAIRGASLSGSRCEAFVRYVGTTADNIVDQSSGSGMFSRAVVIEDGPNHVNNLLVQSAHEGIPDVVHEQAPPPP